jgi:hypothetical protein
MQKSNTVARSLHDVGLAAWFGGSLMGAVGLNAASGQAGEPKERARVADAGWARWTVPNAIAIGAHLVGGAVLLRGGSGRRGSGGRRAGIARFALTGFALGATAYARVQGQKLMDAGDPPVLDGTTPNEDTPAEVADAQRRLKVLQWVIPASTGALLVLDATQREHQRAAGVLERLLPDVVVSSAGERIQEVRGRTAKKARKAGRRAAKRTRRMSKDLQSRARHMSDLALDVTERAQGALERSQEALGKAQGGIGHFPDVVARAGGVAERLPAAVAGRLAG